MANQFKGWVGLLIVGLAASAAFGWLALVPERNCVDVYKFRNLEDVIVDHSGSPFEYRHVLFRTSLGDFYQIGSKYYLIDDLFAKNNEVTDTCIIRKLQKFYHENKHKNNRPINPSEL